MRLSIETKFRVPLKSPETECPRMCKGKFRDSGSTGYGLGELYQTLDDSKVICSILEPKDGERILMARIMEDYDLNEDEDDLDPIADSWKKVLRRRNGKIWWEDLWKLDIEGRAYEPEPKAEEEQPEKPAEPENVYLKEQLQQMMVMLKSMQEGFQDKINQKFEELNGRMCAVEQYVNGKLSEESMGFQFNDYWRGSHRMNNFETGGTAASVKKTVPRAKNAGHDSVDKTVSEALNTPNASQDEVVEKTVPSAGIDAAEKTVSEVSDTPNAGQDEAVKKTVPNAGHAPEKTVSEAPDTPNAGQDEAVEKIVPNAGHDEAVEKMVEPYGHSIINGKRVKQLARKKKTPRPKRMKKPSSVCVTPFVPK